eukprot:m.242965 g.242965  ORF g.242965 m.242965 type:complete len:352 (-) comp19016_c0_seq1:847-1902(-)
MSAARLHHLLTPGPLRVVSGPPGHWQSLRRPPQVVAAASTTASHGRAPETRQSQAQAQPTSRTTSNTSTAPSSTATSATTAASATKGSAPPDAPVRLASTATASSPDLSNAPWLAVSRRPHPRSPVVPSAGPGASEFNIESTAWKQWGQRLCGVTKAALARRRLTQPELAAEAHATTSHLRPAGPDTPSYTASNSWRTDKTTGYYVWPFPVLQRFRIVWALGTRAVIIGLGGAAKVFLNYFSNTKVYNRKSLDAIDRHCKTSNSASRRGLLTYCNHDSCLDDPVIWGLTSMSTLSSHRSRWALSVSRRLQHPMGEQRVLFQLGGGDHFWVWKGASNRAGLRGQSTQRRRDD